MQSSYRSRRRPSRSSVFFFLLAVLFIGVNYFLADDAHAAHDPEMTVEFDTLELVQRRGILVLDYQVNREDWRAMKRAGMSPRLNLHTPDKRGRSFSYAYSVELESRLGRIEFPRALKIRGNRVVSLKVVGFSGFSRVSQTRYGDACGDSVRVRVDRRGRPGHSTGNRKDKGGGHGKGPAKGPAKGHGDSHGTAAIIKACQAHSHSTNVSSCLARARKLPANVSAANTIRACGQATKWNSEFNACMDEATRFRSDETAGLIAACDAQTTWNSELRACMERVATWSNPGAASMVNACGAATEWSSEFNACLDNSKGLGRRGAQVIRACSEATTWSSEFNECLEQASYRRPARGQRT